MVWEGCRFHQGCVCLLFLAISFCGQSLLFSMICVVSLVLETGRNNFCKISERSHKCKGSCTEPFDLILPCSSAYGLQHKIKTFKIEQSEYSVAACGPPDQLSLRPWHISFCVNKLWDCVWIDFSIQSWNGKRKIFRYFYYTYIYIYLNFGTIFFCQKKIIERVHHKSTDKNSSTVCL